MTKKILVAFGTRPEAIKLAPVIRALRIKSEIELRCCNSGQHQDLLTNLLHIFSIRPEYNLDVMRAGQDLTDLTSRLLAGIRDLLNDWRPDLVIVHGDTTTCFAAALAAFYQQIDIAHVEAGLRTGNLTSPFPEEANRTFVGRISRHHFAPTRIARDNLVREGIPERQILVTGNTVIDALLFARQQCQQLEQSGRDQSWRAGIPDSVLRAAANTNRRMILVTAHRRENHGEGFDNVCKALRQLAQTHLDWDIVFPVHPNPNVRRVAHRMLSGLPNLALLEPLDYLAFVWLMNRCDLVLTDSGGLQEEAPALGKPVLVMRDTTERPEAVAAGTTRLVGTDFHRIVNAVTELLTNREKYDDMSTSANPYGDGHAAERIVRTLVAREVRAA